MKKIFIISQNEITTTVGGAIKSFCNFCNMLSENDYDVYGLYYNEKDGMPYIKLNEKVHFVNLYYLKTNITIQNNFANKFEYFTKIEKPNLMIFFFPHIMDQALLNNNFPEIPKILSYRSRPDFYLEYISKTFISNTAKNISYNHVLFDSFVNIAKNISNVPTVSIGNIVENKNIKANLSIEKKKIIYLSRVDEFKGQDFLIKSFSKIANKYQDWMLDIYGEYQPLSIRNDLQKLIDKLKLQNQVFLKDVVKNPLEKMLEYDFCVFPSYFEGFPNGLSEALSVGLPCIGLKKSSGVNELIINGHNGFLVSFNESNFAKKIQFLIQNKDQRIQIGINAVESIKQYSSEIINHKWLDFIDRILQKKEIKELEHKNIEIFSINALFGAVVNNNGKFVSVFRTSRHCFIRVFNIIYKFNIDNKFVKLIFKIIKLIRIL